MSDLSTSRPSATQVLTRGIRQNPEIVDGIWFTMALAVIGTAGGSVIPLVIRAALDHGFGPAGVDTALIGKYVAIATGAMVLIAIAGYWSKVRIFTASERGLANLRVAAFRHVHDLSMLTQNTQRRGALVSRVTSDVDQISQFLQFTGIMMIVSVGQMLVAVVVMLFLSWQLTLVVLVSFVPLTLSLRWLASAMSRAYDRVRASVGEMLAVIAEPVVAAPVVRAYGIEERTQERVDAAVWANYRANIKAQTITAGAFSAAVLVGGIANAAVLGIGVWLGVVGELTAGTLVAFFFLTGLFTGPAQMATQVISDAQNAVSSWRRVLDLLDTPADVVDPAGSGTPLSSGDLAVQFDEVSFGYPAGPLVLDSINVTIEPQQRVAVVGETGSGKTTFAKLLTRLMDPTSGRVLLGGVDLREVSFDQLRAHLLMVPQEGFLFDASLAENLRYGSKEASDAELVEAISGLGLGDWFASLPGGLDTQVGQRGESLSAGERQLVALVRSALADPKILVLDEATSAVDPQTELRATRALDRLLSGRTSVTIAHRLTTAENADRVLVFDQGSLVEDGRHEDLVAAGGVYARLHSAWVAQASLG
ncbi:MAG TPA: ABC transporter ATP-binding protein [Aeromicrobium sp.]|nr:ABC transporter ATP-binding protein [Aeromicrobium sp.]